MSIRLFHFTSREAAEAILKSGFRELSRDGDIGCWFSPNPADVCGDISRQELLHVVLELPDEELAMYAQMVTEGSLDDNDQPVFPPEFPTVPYYWFQIPAEVANRSLISIRVVPLAERLARESGRWYEDEVIAEGPYDAIP